MSGDTATPPGEVEAEADQPFNFLGLPKELRLDIYELLLKPAKLTVYSFDRSDDGTITKSNPDLRLYRKLEDKSVYPELLSTCKAVNSEARDFLCRPETLSLSPSLAEHYEEWDDKETFLLGSETLKKIGFAQNLVVELITSRATRSMDLLHSRVFIDSLRHDFKVEYLSVKLQLVHSHQYVENDDRVCTLLDMTRMWSDGIKATGYSVILDVLEEYGESEGGNMCWCKDKGREWQENDNRPDHSCMHHPVVQVRAAIQSLFN